MYDVARSRAPDVLIGKEDDTYMERWWVIPRNRVFQYLFAPLPALRR